MNTNSRWISHHTEQLILVQIVTESRKREVVKYDPAREQREGWEQKSSTSVYNFEALLHEDGHDFKDLNIASNLSICCESPKSD